MTAYYNEIDPYAAEWLRRLILQGHIAHGDVDERSIEDVTPDDLRKYTQCHFFAGVGVWSLALRNAGWADDRPVWTGSCPCQPFSAAGKGDGFADERHLWPAFFHLIRECRPDVVMGEQVASKDGLGWLDLVQSDLEGEGYASRAVDTCAAGFGAPHIRQRLYWAGASLTLGDAYYPGLEVRRLGPDELLGPQGRQASQRPPGLSVVGGGLALTDDTLGRPDIPRGYDLDGHQARRDEDAGNADPGRGLLRVGDADSDGPGQAERGVSEPDARPADGSGVRPGPTNGPWASVDWLFCRDDRWRPVEPGTFPLAHGAPARVGRLRAYGNAINEAQARGWVENVMADLP